MSFRALCHCVHCNVVIITIRVIVGSAKWHSDAQFVRVHFIREMVDVAIMIIEHRVRYNRSGRNLETAFDEDLDAVRRNQQHRRRRRRGTVGQQAQSMVQLHRQSRSLFSEADPDGHDLQ